MRWHQIGARIESSLLKGGDNPFRIIKITETSFEPAIWLEDIMQHNNELYGDEKLCVLETASAYTTKFLGGCMPYFLFCDLTNNGKVYTLQDPVSKMWLDLYVIHMQLQKVTCNLYVEISTMHRNYGSNTWQAVVHPAALGNGVQVVEADNIQSQSAQNQSSN